MVRESQRRIPILNALKAQIRLLEGEIERYLEEYELKKNNDSFRITPFRPSLGLIENNLTGIFILDEKSNLALQNSIVMINNAVNYSNKPTDSMDLQEYSNNLPEVQRLLKTAKEQLSIVKPSLDDSIKRNRVYPKIILISFSVLIVGIIMLMVVEFLAP